MGESVMPIHPACGHRLGSLGCRNHHQQAGEPVPNLADSLTGGALSGDGIAEKLAQLAVEENITAGYVRVAEVWETDDGPRIRFELTEKGRRRAEELLNLPPGTLTVADDEE